MVIFDGFIAGLFCGFLLAILFMVTIATIYGYRQEKAKEQFGILLNKLNSAANEVKERGNNESIN